MNMSWQGDLFRIAPGPMPMVLFTRVALAVGLPLIGITLAGAPQLGVIGGAIALFTGLCDVGITRRGRAAAMLLGLAFMLVGGVAGDRFGATERASELFVLAAALLAGWVSNSQPAIAAAARCGALATAAGVGMHVGSPLAVVAVFAGGASAIVMAFAAWRVDPVSPDQNFMDWRSGVRRAFAGADAGRRYAVVYAAMVALSLLAAEELGISHPYWAAFTVIMVMRREGLVSLKLVIQYALGTLIGIPVAWSLTYISSESLVIAVLASVAAASARIGMAVNPALGYMGFTIFVVLVVDLALPSAGAPTQLLLTRIVDVGIGCALSLIGLLLATDWRREAAPRSGR